MPTNFLVEKTIRDANGDLFYVYSWSSSTGKLKDLRTCELELFLDYPSIGTTYYPQADQFFYTWPSPMIDLTPNPQVSKDINMNVKKVIDTSAFAPRGGFSPPPYNYQPPYPMFPTSERIQWSCPYVERGIFQSFIRDQTIWRSVSPGADNKWQYQVTRNVDSNTYTLPNQ